MQWFIDKINLALGKPMHVSPVLLAAVILVGLDGCGGPREPMGDVSGKVMSAGKPATQVNVQFFRADGVPVGAAKVNPAGGFRFERQIPVGNYGVAILPAVEETRDGAEAPGRKQVIDKVPQKYWDHNTSGFSAEVKEGDNSFMFEMR
ncbi:MAG: carboxypeptidase regulatory-like domain-containing protein [Pirellulales bacterium]|nr:carboxypeptidase regulatory-like domain-containing protein [Pirellulales bacterium]